MREAQYRRCWDEHRAIGTFGWPALDVLTRLSVLGRGAGPRDGAPLPVARGGADRMTPERRAEIYAWLAYMDRVSDVPPDVTLGPVYIRSLLAEVNRLTAERDQARADLSDARISLGQRVLDELPEGDLANSDAELRDLVTRIRAAVDGPTEPASGPVVLCGSMTQAAELAALGEQYRSQGHEQVIVPDPTDPRDRSTVDAEWLRHIEGASLVVVLRKPDGSVGAQTFEEVSRAYECGVPVHRWMPPGTVSEEERRQVVEALHAGRVGCVVTTDDMPEYWPDCEECQGAWRTGECQPCDGSGEHYGRPYAAAPSSPPCWWCEGTGLAEQCEACGGMGKVRPPATPDAVTEPGRDRAEGSHEARAVLPVARGALGRRDHRGGDVTGSPPLHNLLVRHDNRFWPWDPRSCPDERCPWNEWARKHLPASEPEHQPERTYVPGEPLPEIGCTCALGRPGALCGCVPLTTEEAGDA
jgi:hypothetical protein